MRVKDPIEVHQAVYYGKISLECARALGVSLMAVHSDVSKKLPQNVREKCLTEIFNDEIKPFAKSLGIKLALENLSYTSTGFGKNVNQLEEVLNVIDKERGMENNIRLMPYTGNQKNRQPARKILVACLQRSHGKQIARAFHRSKTRTHRLPL